MLNCGHKLRTLPQCKQIPVYWIGFTLFFKANLDSVKKIMYMPTSRFKNYLKFVISNCSLSFNQTCKKFQNPQFNQNPNFLHIKIETKITENFRSVSR